MTGQHDKLTDTVSDEILRDWLDSLDDTLRLEGPEEVVRILETLGQHAYARGIRLPFSANTPYVNTIPPSDEPSYPGDREMERRIKSIVRWNAMAMVVRANRSEKGIGGHISTYASAATLYEVGFNHFFRGRTDTFPGDIIYFQGHASPGIYSRAFLEGRLEAEHLENFRRELREHPGLSSYPHPWLMPDFWQFPTVSMGLGPITSIYHARFIQYLHDRGLREPCDQRVWAFLGDGETDEPETLGAIALAARERLDKLVFVIKCNLQRLDGPVRGNGKVIQELESTFRGAGWNVIKVIWGSDWDPLFERDDDGLLVSRMGEVVDGQYQKYSVETGEFIRNDFFGRYPQLLKMVEHLSDEQLQKMRRGGHDPVKVYAAYLRAMENTGAPTVILCKTIKGYGLGESGEGKNITHAQKLLNDEELREFRSRFAIPLSDEDVSELPFFRPPDDSPEMEYVRERRGELGGHVPSRRTTYIPVGSPDPGAFEEFNDGSEHPVSTTMVFVRLLGKLLRDKEIGKLIVPIVPDEARTFGMEALFRQCGIYSHPGQLYEPVDAKNLLYYKETRDGQILEEGITEAGSMSSFVAAGTAYANHGVNTIPFFIYYSMFGFQRIGDLAWLAGDSRCRGFLMGATAGRTTLAGEGLQHQDGHSHVLSLPIPNLKSYDPAYAYELAVIIKEGIRRMYVNGEDIFYYITISNENYRQPAMPEGVEEGILKGIYRLPAEENPDAVARVRLLGSGAIMRQVLKARDYLAYTYNIAADVWSVTSYKELLNDALDVERWNSLHPSDPERVPYIAQSLSSGEGPVVAASDYMKVLPASLAKWIPGDLVSLGTDGFGRSETRGELRRFFEVDTRFITWTVLSKLVRDGAMGPEVLESAQKELGVEPERPNPITR